MADGYYNNCRRRKRMQLAVRSTVSAVMLGVACLVGTAIVLALALALVLALAAGGAWSLLAGIVMAGLLAAFGVALFVRRQRRGRRAGEGVPITTEEQPLFWVEVYRVAEGLELRPPDELFLFADATVSVSEDRTWLGLRPGVRRLHLGLPLLAGLTQRELRAVIAHEFWRCWGPFSLARVIYRGQEIIGRVADRVGEDSRAGRIIGRICRLYLAVSHPVTREFGFEADRLSADFAGNNATAAALAELEVLGKAWAGFVDGYAGPAAAAGRRPEDLFAGFTRFLNEPGRRAQLAASADQIGSPEGSAYRSQPLLEDRLAAIASLPEDDIHDKSGPALGAVRDPDRVIRSVEESMFQESGSAPSTWENIGPEVGGAAALKDALQLQRLGHEGGLGPTLSVATLLELLRHGLVDEMVRPVVAHGASHEVELRTAGRLVTGFLATAAIESGTASYRFSWATPRQLFDAQGAVDDLPILVDAALADATTVPALELWLTAHRIGEELELGADAEPDAPVVQSQVNGDGARGDEDPTMLSVPVSGGSSF
jgi:hypothetical protein